MAGTLGRQLSYQVQRHLLRRRTMLADGLPLDMRFRFHARDDVGRRLYKRRMHEPHIFQRLVDNRQFFRGGLAIDAGANLGWYSVLFERLSGGTASVLACEPDPANLELLRGNLALNRAQGVQVLAAALSDHIGTASLHRYGDINLGRHSLLRSERSLEAVDVGLTTLDAEMERRGLTDREITILKADVEGHEPELLAGAPLALKRTRMLVLEYSPMYYETASASAMLESLFDTGLRPLAWLDGGWRPVTADELLATIAQCDTWWERVAQTAGN